QALLQLFASVSAYLQQRDDSAPALTRARQLAAFLGAERPCLRARADALQAGLAAGDQQLAFATGAELYLRFVAELEAYVASYVDLARPLSRRPDAERADTR